MDNSCGFDSQTYHYQRQFGQKETIETIYHNLIILRDQGQLNKAIKGYSQEERQMIMTVLKLANLSPMLGMNDQKISFQNKADGFVIIGDKGEVGSFKQDQLNRFGRKLHTLTEQVQQGGEIIEKVSNVWEKFGKGFMKLFNSNWITSQQIMNQVKPFDTYWSKLCT